MQSKNRSLTNSDSQKEAMQQIACDRVTRFVENKFRVSRSYPTMTTYRHTVNRFLKFLRIKYNLEISELLIQIKEKKAFRVTKPEGIDEDLFMTVIKSERHLRSPR